MTEGTDRAHRLHVVVLRLASAAVVATTSVIHMHALHHDWLAFAIVDLLLTSRHTSSTGCAFRSVMCSRVTHAVTLRLVLCPMSDTITL